MSSIHLADIGNFSLIAAYVISLFAVVTALAGTGDRRLLVRTIAVTVGVWLFADLLLPITESALDGQGIMMNAVGMLAILGGAAVMWRMSERVPVTNPDPRLTAVGERSVYAVFGLVTLSMVTVIAALVQDGFGIEYVASHSNRALPLHYKIGSLWSGQEGSLLLWTFVLVSFAAAGVFTQRKRHNRLLPYAVAVMMGVSAFFLYINNFKTNPFEQLVGVTASGAEVDWQPQDGRGLNPLLQHWAMVIHPPILYIGYIGFVVPFAFCIAALVTRQLGSAWVRTVRRTTLVSWVFLSAGIILGGKWAYMELGWGGYWAWDPVENASLLPWLSGTAFLHSVIVQEKRGILKVWNVVLIALTFWLSVLGTFLTRSGVVSSVHSFAQSNVGWTFGVFLVVSLIGMTVLIISRLPDLRDESRLDHVMSREAGFLFNNLLLLVACVSVLFGTVFPIFSELFTGKNVSVGQEFFNTIEIPVALLLLALTGIGPLLAYRKTTSSSLRKNFTMPLVVGVVSAPLFFVLTKSIYGRPAGVFALTSLTLCAFVTTTIIQEFHKGTMARVRQHGENYFNAIANLTRRNNRRYGGYVVHFGMVLLFVGVTGQAFTKEVRGVLGRGESMKVGAYELRVDEMSERENDNYWSGQLDVAVYRNDQPAFMLHPEKRFYFASEQPSSEVAIARQLSEDLYVVYAGTNEEQTKAVIQAYINPLVAWVWIGGLVVILGTLVCLAPPLKTASAHREA